MVRLGDPFSKINSITTDEYVPDVLYCIVTCYFFTERVYAVFSSPWNPLKKNKKKDCKIDIKDDVFAYATTLWEIFSRGSIPIVKKVIYVALYCLEKWIDEVGISLPCRVFFDGLIWKCSVRLRNIVIIINIINIDCLYSPSLCSKSN